MKPARIADFSDLDDDVEEWDIGRVLGPPHELEAMSGLNFERLSTPIGDMLVAAGYTEGGTVLFKWLDNEDWDEGIVVQLQSDAPSPEKAVAELVTLFGPDLFVPDHDKLQNRIWEVWRLPAVGEGVLIARTYTFEEAQDLALRLDGALEEGSHEVRRTL